MWLEDPRLSRASAHRIVVLVVISSVSPIELVVDSILLSAARKALINK